MTLPHRRPGAALFEADPHWRDHAKCGALDPEDLDRMFFPRSYVDPEGRRAVAEARQVCASCPVFSNCEADTEEREGDLAAVHGVAAGLTPDERKARRRANAR